MPQQAKIQKQTNQQPKQQAKRDTLVPKYKNHEFAGYAVVGADGKEKALIAQKDFKFITHDGCPKGCEIQYKGQVWRIDDAKLNKDIQPELVYVPSERLGEFNIKQRGETIGKLTYKDLQFSAVKMKNGTTKYKMEWTNAYDGQTRFIGYLSAEEKTKMDASNQSNLTKTLGENAQPVRLDQSENAPTNIPIRDKVGLTY